MRKRVLILTAAVLLALALAVPASASWPMTVGGAFITDIFSLKDEEVPVGNRCFVNVWYDASLAGDILTASCAIHEWQVAHGPCDEETAPGVYAHIFPGKYKETLHLEADCTATVQGKSGTFQLRGNGQLLPGADPPVPFVMHWQENCRIQSGTGELTDLHGSLTLESHPDQPGAYSGKIHFDPK